MRRILNEVARMKKIAGIISEGKYEEGADMATSEEITMEGDEVNEARGGQLQPIDPAALKKVIALGVKSEVLSPQDVSYLMKRFAAIPVLVNKAIAGDEKAYYDVMAGGDWPEPEYSNADDKRLAKYYEKLSDLMAAVDAVMYEGELEVIPSRWNKLKAHIEGM